jgi:hypothetical protein
MSSPFEKMARLMNSDARLIGRETDIAGTAIAIL